MAAAALIGRDHPAGILRAWIDRTAQGRGGLVLVTGEAGIGKTTLVTEATEHARQSGALVLGGSCWDSDSAPGYWPWVQVVRALRRAATEDEWALAAAAAGGALAVLLGESPGEAPGDDGFRLFDAITSALVSVSQQRPVVVVLDDLHWSDPASVKLLAFAAQHAWFERLLLVGTYRDVEVEATGHPLEPLILPLLTKATTITLTGLDRAEVGALMARTVGREPTEDLIGEVHLRTGGNPFFVEQTARLWRSAGTASAIAPGVREAVRQRLAQLPKPVETLLTAAAVLGREFHRQVLAASVASPVPEVDRLLDQAAAARLVQGHGGGRFGFAHDLVRETLYESIDQADLRRRHATVLTVLDGLPGLGEQTFPADLARHAYLADGEIAPERAMAILLAAGREAGTRLATEEAVGHYRRALERVTDDHGRAMVNMHLGTELQHTDEQELGWQHLRMAASLAREVAEPDLLGRVAITLFRYRTPTADAPMVDALVRTAYEVVTGEKPGRASVDELAQNLIIRTATTARRGQDDEALSFSLSARHDTIWGLGTAPERVALTEELATIAARTGDRDLQQYASSLRWVALLEQGDPAYLDQYREFVALAGQFNTPRFTTGSIIDQSLITAMLGRFDEAQELLDRLGAPGEGHPDYWGMVNHLRWALLLRRGRFEEAAKVLDSAGEKDYPQLALVSAITSAEQGDGAVAARKLATVAEPVHRAFAPLWLRASAQVAAATGDDELGERVRTALLPHRGEWTVSMWGCDLSGPVDLWLGVVDAAQSRWDDAVDHFRSAVATADRLSARAWALEAVVGLIDALRARAGAGDRAEAEALLLRAEAEVEQLDLGYLLGRIRPGSAEPAVAERPTGVVFRPDGPVWTLTYAGRTAHLPDTKGLRDLHSLLSRPGEDIPAVRLLDPAGGEVVVAASRLGGDAVLDDEAKARYRRRLDELDERIDQAAAVGDDRRAAGYDRERQALLTELRAAAGLGGRDRRLGDAAERARKTVTARIRDTLRKLDEAHPELAAHLRASVSTGSTCRYSPD